MWWKKKKDRTIEHCSVQLGVEIDPRMKIQEMIDAGQYSTPHSWSKAPEACLFTRQVFPMGDGDKPIGLTLTLFTMIREVTTWELLRYRELIGLHSVPTEITLAVGAQHPQIYYCRDIVDLDTNWIDHESLKKKVCLCLSNSKTEGHRLWHAGFESTWTQGWWFMGLDNSSVYWLQRGGDPCITLR